jgi:hypothetical protein
MAADHWPRRRLRFLLMAAVGGWRGTCRFACQIGVRLRVERPKRHRHASATARIALLRLTEALTSS